MKVIAFVNNLVGLRSLETVMQHRDTIVAIVVHPRESSQYLDPILAASAIHQPVVFEAGKLRDPGSIEKINALQPEIGVSAFFGHILKPEIINLFPRGIVNVHPAYLPYNRSAYPNVWAIVDRTPAGATIHFIDEGVDTGDIIDQVEIEVAPADTGESLYQKLETACIELFARTWPAIAQAPGRISAKAQEPSEGSLHRVYDTRQIDRIDLDKNYRAGDLLNIIRARTFTGYKGAYFEADGDRYFLRIDIEKEVPEENSQ